MPLLHDNQDPEGLAAVVAYHLHALDISRDVLVQAGIPQVMARQLRQGALTLKHSDARDLAQLLQRDPEDLLSPLSEQQKSEWAFYRVSARHAAEVWKRVAAASTAANVTQRQLGVILGLPQRTVSKLLSGKQATPILQHDQADKFAGVIGAQQGAEIFIEGFEDIEQTRGPR